MNPPSHDPLRKALEKLMEGSTGAIAQWRLRDLIAAHPSPQPADAGLREALARLLVKLDPPDESLISEEVASKAAMIDAAVILDFLRDRSALSAAGMRESGEAAEQLRRGLLLVALLKDAAKLLDVAGLWKAPVDEQWRQSYSDWRTRYDAVNTAPPRQPGPEHPKLSVEVQEGYEPAPEPKETTIDGQCDTCGHLYTDLMMANLHEEDHPGHTIIWNYDASPEAREPGGGK